MIPPPPAARRLAALVLAAVSITCSDAPTGPGGGRASLALAPGFPPGASLAAFGIAIDSVRALVIRPASDTIVRRTVPFPADSSGIELSLSVNLRDSVETLVVTLEFRGGGVPLFAGTQSVEVRPGPSDGTLPTTIPMSYVGPGAEVDSLVVSPVDSVVTWNDSLRFRVEAYQAGSPVAQFYVSWTSDDPTAPINAFGILRAPSRRDTVVVTARTPPTSQAPAGISASVAAALVPPPSAVAVAGGNLQNGSTGSPLEQPLRVRVTAGDGFAVPRSPVRFRAALGGGSVADTLVHTDAGGFAQTTALLGPTMGEQRFEASVTGLQVVTFVATAVAGPPVQLAFVGQPGTATAGQAMAPAVEVAAQDAFGNTAIGFTGSITVALGANPGGGRLAGAATVAAVAGVASFTTLSIDRAGTGYTLVAGAANLTQATSGGFDVTPAAASQMALNAGDGQTATVNTPVAIRPSVMVRDAFNNPVPGHSVTFTVTSGGGSVGSGNATTDANGVATVVSWTLGTAAGANNNTLQAAAAGLTGSPVTFTASAGAAAASQIALNAGDNQTATVNTAVAIPPSVIVRDQFNNPVAGVSVTFAVTGGGGSTSPASPATVLTNASGIAALTSWTLGTAAGTGNNRLQATAASLAGSPVTFTASATAAAASQIAPNAGDNQTATVNTAVAVPPSVLVRDQLNNPVVGVAVTFTVTAGGGSIVGGNATTNASGIAAVTSWTLGTVAGTDTDTLQATASGLTGSPVTFTASATAAAASQITLNAGDNQTATVNSAVAIPPSVLVRDPFDNPVAGVAVTFTVTGGGGSVVGGNPITDATGIAAATSWTLGSAAGTNSNTLEASATGLTGSPVTFTASAVAAGAGQIALNAGDNQTATVNTAVAIPPSVIVRDQFNNPVAGVAVTFTVTGGGGSVAGGNATTDANGMAAVTSWTLGAVAGTDSDTLQATAAGLAGSPVTFTASATAAAASLLAFTGQPSDAVAGVTMAPAVVVTVRDAFGNTASGFAGSVSVVRSDLVDCFATLLGTTTVPAVGGVAIFSDLRFNGACPGMRLQASSGTLPPVQSNPFTITAAAATQLTLVSGDGQAALAGGLLPEVLAVRVTDQFDNGIGGVPITWEVIAGGGAVAPLPSATDAGGFAAVGWTLGPSAGSNVVLASSGTLAGSPVMFTATGVPAGTTRLWVGGDATQPTDWSTDANWREGVAPAASDHVFVPAGAANQPVISQGAVVGNLVVEAGASVTIGTGVVLTAGGSVNAGLTIGGAGSLALTGTGVTLQGSVPNLVVSGQVAAAGLVFVSGDLLVTGSLNLGGQGVTVAGDFATSGQGTLTMTQPSDLLVVQGNAGFNGGATLGLLSAGTVAVAGDFVASDSNSSTPFAATGTHTVILNGATLQRVSGVAALRVNQSHFQDLDIASTDSVRPTTGLRANGTVVVSSGAFDVGGQSVSVGGDFVTAGTGILRMTNAADLLAVQGNATFAGGNESAQLFNGVLRVGENFTQLGSPAGGGSFEGVVSHVVEMNGTAPQMIGFEDPVFSHFGNLVISNPAGVSAVSNVPVVEGLTVQAGAALTLGSFVLTATNVVNDGTLDVGTGTLDASGSLTHSAGAVLQGSGTVDVTGTTVSSFNGSVRPGTSPGLLTITGGAALGSTAVVEIELAGNATPGSDYDQLRVATDSVALGGSLNVTALTGFAPRAGDSFQVLTFARRVGNFAAISGLDPGGGVVLDTVWSATDLKLVARQVIVLDAAPVDLAVSPPSSRIYALATPGGAKQSGPTSVVAIDANTDMPVDTVVLDGAANAYALSVNTANDKAYVSDFLGGLFVVEGTTGTLKTTIPLPQPGFTTADETKSLVYLPAGVQVGLDPNCVASLCPIYAPVLFKVDGTTDTLFTTDTVFVGGWDWHAYGAAFNPNNGLVYVAIYDSARITRNVVRIVDPGARAIVGSITVAGNPWAVAINPSTNKLYVSSDADNSVSVVNLNTGSVKPIPIGGYIPNITVDVAGNRIYVPNYDNSTVTVIDGSTDEVLTVLQAGAPGDGAYDAVVSPVNGVLLYVARFNAGEITILPRP